MMRSLVLPLVPEIIVDAIVNIVSISSVEAKILLRLLFSVIGSIMAIIVDTPFDHNNTCVTLALGQTSESI